LAFFILSNMEYQKHHLNIYPEMQAEEFNRLREDIFVNGYDHKNPIILFEGQIIDGWNRYRACSALGVEPKFQTFTGSEIDAMQIVIRTNNRRDLTSSQRAAIAVEAEDLIAVLKAEAKERSLANLKKGNEKPEVELIPPRGNPEQNKVRNKLAETFGTNPRYVSDMAQIKDDAPEEFEQIKSGKKTISEFKKEKKQKQRIEKIEELKKRISENKGIGIDKKYHAICIDPPWAYEEKGGFTVNEHDADSNRGGVDYPTMTVQQIGKIELPAANDCVLFLWTTHAFLEDSFSLLRDWGFQYKATLVWDKEKMGIGRTVRMQVEFCLLGVKGSPIIQGSSERDIIREARREHSRKPDAFYDMVNRMCIGNKLDYFSRENRDNWDTYGAETNKF
jgi:N6-adenosine-specific RNA methylase IME4